MSAHTPTPWLWRSPELRGANGTHIAHLRLGVDLPAEHEANGQRIKSCVEALEGTEIAPDAPVGWATQALARLGEVEAQRDALLKAATFALSTPGMIKGRDALQAAVTKAGGNG